MVRRENKRSITEHNREAEERDGRREKERERERERGGERELGERRYREKRATIER